MNGSAKRRMLERFDLSMPAVIMSEKMDREVKALTKNISAGGAFSRLFQFLKKG